MDSPCIIERGISIIAGDPTHNDTVLDIVVVTSEKSAPFLGYGLTLDGDEIQVDDGEMFYTYPFDNAGSERRIYRLVGKVWTPHNLAFAVNTVGRLRKKAVACDVQQLLNVLSGDAQQSFLTFQRCLFVPVVFFKDQSALVHPARLPENQLLHPIKKYLLSEGFKDPKKPDKKEKKAA